MNIIDNIEIKNFKSIRHQKIEGCKRINVFVGPPNVGKSNILEALSGFSILNKNVFNKKNIKSLIRFSRFTDFFFNAEIKQPISICINNSERELHYQFNGFENLTLIISEPFHESKLEDGILTKLGYVILNVLVNNDGKIKDVKREKSTENILIKKYSHNSAINFNSSKSLNLNDIVEGNPELRKNCNEMLKEYDLNLHFDRTKEKNKLELRKNLRDGTTITLDWNLIADTLQRVFFYKAAILSNQNSVLLFEEPEAHIYPPYISKFTSDMIYDENNNQFFLTTHSPFVLNELMENCKEDLAIYTVGYKKDTGETIVNKLSDDDMHEAAQFGYDFFLNLNNFIPAN
jgi:AAA15 family ATPase/GTPase